MRLHAPLEILFFSYLEITEKAPYDKISARMLELGS